jgi:hypothetical protein
VGREGRNLPLRIKSYPHSAATVLLTPYSLALICECIFSWSPMQIQKSC